MEAAKRGLSNYSTTAEALPHYISQKNIDLVTKHGIFTESEFKARHEIHLESYNKLINIEARTMVDMVMHQILPAAIHYSSDLADAINRKQSALQCSMENSAELSLVQRISTRCDSLYKHSEDLYRNLKDVPANSDEAVAYYSRIIIPAMHLVRKDADHLEKLTAKSYWPYPLYSDILFY